MRWTCTCFISLALAAAIPGAALAQAPRPISWDADAQPFRGRTDEIRLSCSGAGRISTVWGTGPYTDDSSICTAAVHAGLITVADGGRFVLEAGPGKAAYAAGRRNGIVTQSYGAWESSFYLSPWEEEPPAPEPPPPASPPAASAPPGPPVITWLRTAPGLAPNGGRFTFICRPPAKNASVIGDGVYSAEASICNAAVHAGIITKARGGRVTIVLLPGPDTYAATTRNGIASIKGQRTLLGFVFVRKTP
jgi:hypothetical protein